MNETTPPHKASTERLNPRPLLIAIAAHWAFLIGAGLFATLNPAIARLSMMLLLFGCAALLGPATRLRTQLLLWLGPLAILLTATGQGGQGETGPVLAVLCWFALLSWWIDDLKKPNPILGRIALALAVCTLLFFAYRTTTTGWRLVDGAGLGLSWATAQITGDLMRLGPTYGGLWSLIFFAALVFPYRKPVAAEFGMWRNWTLFGALAVGLTLTYTATHLWLDRQLRHGVETLLNPPEPHPHIHIEAAVLLPIALLMLASVLGVAAMWYLRSQPTIQLAVPQKQKLTFIAIALVFCGAFLLDARFLAPAAQHQTGGHIAFWDPGYLEKSQMEPGRYGLAFQGMFGMIQTYLKASGCRISSLEAISNEALSDIDTLVVINPRETFSPQDHDTIWSFVERGGGLLVMGDHTDIYGIMKPLNTLLEPVDVNFVFDSAFPLRDHWKNALTFLPHPITQGLKRPYQTQIGTGGSLILKGDEAKPIIVSHHAFGDFGNRANAGTGGLLGDYRYQIGEKLGEIVLAAAAEHGDGKVVIFGDTSSFQNIALYKAYPFIDRIFGHLNTPPKPDWPGFLGVPAVLTGFALFWFGGSLSGLPVAAIMLLAATFCFGFWPTPRFELSHFQSDTAVIDIDHVPRHDLQSFVEYSAEGLAPALTRAGYLTFTSEDLGDDFLDEADFYALVGPSKPLSDKEQQRLKTFLEQGGTVLLAANLPDRGVANSFLADFGLELSPKIVGNVRVQLGEMTLEFNEALALHQQGVDDWRALVQWEHHSIAAQRKVGAGRLIVIGDATFFLDKHLEGEIKFKLGNVRFLEALLAKGVKS